MWQLGVDQDLASMLARDGSILTNGEFAEDVVVASLRGARCRIFAKDRYRQRNRSQMIPALQQ